MSTCLFSLPHANLWSPRHIAKCHHSILQYSSLTESPCPEFWPLFLSCDWLSWSQKPIPPPHFFYGEAVPGIFKNTINSHLINNKLSPNQMRNASPIEFQRRYSLGWKKSSQKQRSLGLNRTIGQWWEEGRTCQKEKDCSKSERVLNNLNTSLSIFWMQVPCQILMPIYIDIYGGTHAIIICLERRVKWWV